MYVYVYVWYERKFAMCCKEDEDTLKKVLRNQSNRYKLIMSYVVKLFKFAEIVEKLK